MGLYGRCEDSPPASSDLYGQGRLRRQGPHRRFAVLLRPGDLDVVDAEGGHQETGLDPGVA